MIVKDDPHASIHLIRERLVARGYAVEELDLRGRLYYRFVSPNGRSWTVLAHKIGYPFPSLVTSKLSCNKALTNELAMHAGVPIPASVVVPHGGSLDDAKQLLHRYGKVVVKPLDSTLARGLTLDVMDEAALQQALDYAYKTAGTAIVQEQVIGEEIRFPVIGGRIRAALLRRTPQVAGDGVHTVADLIKLENEARAALRMPYVTYPQLTAALINQKYFTDMTVLEKGQILELGKGTMIKTGASIYNVLDQVHPSYLDDIERLAGLLGFGFVVIDMFLSRFTEPKKEGNYWFIESNNAPVLKLFYSCRDGKMFDVLELLVPMIDEAVSGIHH